MSYEILLDDSATLVEKPGVVVLDMGTTSPTDVAVGLAMLNESVVEQVILRTPKAPWGVRIKKSALPRERSWRRYMTDRHEIVLGKITLESWLLFFLKYCRDGYAEVDHLDIEATADSGGGCDIVLKVAHAASPTSEDEARRRLGLSRSS